MCNQSQTGRKADDRLWNMGVKYYTQFVLTDPARDGPEQQFSGVVEVNRPTEQRLGAREIEALLARNLEVRSGGVQLIDWARLQ
jgi:hypothetical protein